MIWLGCWITSGLDPRQAFALGGDKVVFIAAICVVSVRVREDGTLYRLPWIDVKITLFAIKPAARERDEAAFLHR